MDPDTEKKLKEEYEAKRNTRAEVCTNINGIYKIEPQVYLLRWLEAFDICQIVWTSTS